MASCIESSLRHRPESGRSSKRGDPAVRARQHRVNTAHAALTGVGMAARDRGSVSGPESKTIVVRAWRDRGRLIIRVLAGSGALGSAQEWVFADIDASLAH